MGSIIGSSVREDGKVVFEVCVESDEALQLKGQVDNVFLVPQSTTGEKTKAVQRGKNEATMYFLIPKSARKGLKAQNTADFQKIKASDKTLFVYTIKND